ncbi:Hypothetical protein HVR_LOCUS1024 [uncultured virus]|nr:Hypothetical protein HVR_LOCUS1024 [uncultured virus]
MSSHKLDNFLKEICEGVSFRKEARKHDAYFVIPEDISHEEVKVIIGRLNDEHQITSRLYGPRRLQAFWCARPLTNTHEYFARIDPIMDPDEFLRFY